jgi:hypothetical protein
MPNLVQSEANRLLDLSLPAAGCTVKLTSTAPTATTAGTVLAGSGYADQAIATAAASAGAKTFPTADVLFPAATGADWATIVGLELWNGTERRWFKALSASEQRTVKVGDQYRIAANSLSAAAS